ncbi:MAG: DUF1653 domain-containing protein [Legionella sp.]|nr:DUF1653 domain-containing protein [Legionella sp.]
MPKANERYQHYKNGKQYEIVACAIHSETHEALVVYKALYHCDKFGNNQIWVRPKSMFNETVLYEGKLVQRFQLIK